MAGETTSTNMNMPIPGVGVTSGPTYATDLNNSLTIIDQHDHSPGKGVPVTPAGLSISTDLPFNSNNATLLRSARFSPQSAVLSGASDIGCIYEVGVDLYYNDGSGNHVRITQSGGVAGSPGSIAGLTSPASATYVSASQTFVFQSAANTPANLDGGYLNLRNNVANSNALTLSPPASMASNMTITLPSLPASQKIVTLDNAGTMSAPWSVDNSTIVVASNLLGVPASGIGTTQLGAGAVTGAKIASATITTSNIASNTILGSNIAGQTIGGSNIANGTITNTQVAAGTLLGSNMASSTILGTNIAGATITASNIASSTITGTQIASNTVSPTNRTNANHASSTGYNTTITSTTLGAVSNNATITASGTQGVMVSMVPGGFGAGNYGYVQVSGAMLLVLQRNGSTIAQYSLGSNNNLLFTFPPSGYIDFPPAGSITYSWLGAVLASGQQAQIVNCITQVVEL